MKHPHIWPPFANLATLPTPLKVISGKGSKLTLDDGREIIDCVSSWWVNVLGHSNPAIANAIYKQAQQLEHVIFSGFTHQPAEDVATKLIESLPKGFERVFFSDNGSTAVEVALKMALQYWKNKGEKRKRIIAFSGAYHGDTFGAMSVAERNIFNEAFHDHLFEVDFVPYPSTWDGDADIEDKEEAAIEVLEDLLVKYEDEYAAIIIEPIIQGAGGMNVCRKEFIQKLHWTQRQFGTLLIFDEVMTGFGRTGSLFASQYSQVTPDIICLSKGITGGFLPLSVTITSDEIYQAFNKAGAEYTFYHGHSYTANPIACAAAVTTIDLLQETNKNGLKPFEHTAQQLASVKEYLKENHLHKIEKIRQVGCMLAVDIKTSEEGGYLNNVASTIKETCVENGLLIRPLGNVLYLLPPYCLSDNDIDQIKKGLSSILNSL